MPPRHDPQPTVPQRVSGVLLAALLAACGGESGDHPSDGEDADVSLSDASHDADAGEGTGDVAGDAGAEPADVIDDAPLDSAEDASVDVASRFPALLSETSWFDDVGALTPAPQLVGFDVLVPFFSDHVDKRRYVTVPVGASITQAAEGALVYPPGTAFIKVMSDPAVTDRPWLEVRAWQLIDARWYPATWIWDGEIADGTRVDEGATLDRPHPTDPDSADNSYLVPAAIECVRCHGDNNPTPLGFAPRQLDRDDDPGAARLVAAGILDRPISSDRRLIDPYGDGPLDQRARSWIDVNCGSCHAPGQAGARRGLVLGLDAATDRELGICQYETLGSPTPADIYLLVSPGDASRSAMWYRTASLDARARMPDVAYATLDEFGADLVASWIDAMTDTPCEDR